MMAIIILAICFAIYYLVYKGFMYMDRLKNKRDNEKRLKQFNKNEKQKEK